MTDYTKLKVTELKELLKERGIASTGLSRKAQIVEALEADDVKVIETKDDDGTALEDTAGEQELEDAGVVQKDSGETGEGVVTGQDAGEPVEAEDTTMGNGHAGVAVAEMTTILTEQGETSQNAPEEVEATAQDTVITYSDVPLESKDEGTAVLGDQTPETAMQVDAPPPSSLETLKRKRRSPTPELSDSSVKKKLKSAEDDLPKLPEDQVVEDAPVPMDEDKFEVSPSTKALPYSTSDDLLRETPITPDLPSQALESVEKLQHEPEQDATHDEDSSALDDSSTPPSVHPPTQSLYIRDLMRPIQPQQLRSHLCDLAPPQDTDVVELSLFHVDNIRTHAFATFPSTSMARRVRSLLHGQVWPDESTRKPLWVDFVPDNEVKDWVVREEESIGSKRDVRRWEVLYSTSEYGKVTATLEEITAPTGPRRQSSSAGHSGQVSFPNGGGAPQNAPLGPRNNGAPSQRPPTRPSPAAVLRRQSSSDANFVSLDTRFPSTQTAKPKLYYLPVSETLATARLDALEAITSRTWDGGRVMAKGVSGRDGEQRRYTFEDGEKVVDNGADFGHYGRGRGGMGRGGYGGRGGRGGWR